MPSPPRWQKLARGRAVPRRGKMNGLETARIRIKVAADLFPFRFVAIKRVSNRWECEEF